MSYEVFISYRSEDEAIAKALERGLDKLAGPGYITVHLAANMRGGVEWEQWIKEKTRSSSALIFLFTDENANWDWCLYEIGLFRGSRRALAPRSAVKKKGAGQNPGARQGAGDPASDTGAAANTGIACIKDVNSKLPPQLKSIQSYNADADGLEGFFRQLVFQGVFNKNTPVRVMPVGDKAKSDVITKDLKQVVGDTALYFRHRTEFSKYRVGITLCKPGDIGSTSTNHVPGAGQVQRLPSSEWVISGEGGREAMNILGAASESETWDSVYRHFKSLGQNRWMDELKQSIDGQDKRLASPIDRSLSPFQSASGATHIPVISRVETYRYSSTDEINQKIVVVPSRIFVILVPALEKAFGLRNFVDFFKSDDCTVYPPASVVRVRWKGPRCGETYDPDDLDGEPVVCDANDKFVRLFNHTGKPPNPDGAHKWTLRELLNRVNIYVDDKAMECLKADQASLNAHILLKGEDDFARVPLTFLAYAKPGALRPHPHYAGKSFIPYLVAKQLVGELSGPHEYYLLVCFIEQEVATAQ